jgi:putative acetyltransferase
MIEIIQPKTEPELQQVRQVFREYEKYLGFELDFQSFEDELRSLPGVYSPPAGRLFMAVDNGSRPAGTVALKKIDDGICEMKRLYVRPEYRGHKLGLRLAELIIDEAREIGYKKMRLDSLKRLTEALSLYKKLGFIQTDPYVYNPLEDVVYMGLDLTVQS